jgi:uncharacterized repeat protein (TIGR03803 family)
MSLVKLRLSSPLFRLFILLVVCAASSNAVAQTYSNTTLWTFCLHLNCTDGAAPQGSLIQAADGNFYGTTSGYSTNSGGTVYKITPGGTLSTLYFFCAATNYQNCTDGYAPMAGLTQGADGNFYGTTYEGGNVNICSGLEPGCGTIFKITPGGTLTTLYTFGHDEDFTDGQGPLGLTLGADGNFYGVTAGGGKSTSGTIFKITPQGTFTSLYSFCAKANCTDGAFPLGGLVQGSDGNFYGATAEFGTAGAEGVLFKMTSAGAYSVIYDFCNSSSYCPYGANPNAPLIEGADGEFYGTTSAGGTTSDGAIFKVTAGGTLTPLYSFLCTASGNGPVCNYGSTPEAGLFLASGGNFYGTTSASGNNNNAGAGSIYKYASGAITPLYVFCNFSGCPDGSDPTTSVLQAADGNFYGTTLTGGLISGDGAPGGGGTVYKIGVAPALAAPVQVSLSQSQIGLGSPVTLSFRVLNAFSDTLQQCYAFQTLTGKLTALGKITGSLSGGVYSGSTMVTPSATGTYNYAVTCGGQESGYGTLTVTTARKTSSTALAASPNPATVGQTVTLTSTVTGSGTTPTGTVTFSIGTTKLATVTLSGGKASTSASTNGIAPGGYPVVAAYSGDATYSASTSPSYTVTLNKAATKTTLTASPNPVTPPAACTLTAKVARTTGSGFATGTVTFSVNGTAVGSAKLNASGVATLSAATGSVAAGSYPVIAKYGGDGDDNTSTSSVVTVVVK